MPWHSNVMMIIIIIIMVHNIPLMSNYNKGWCVCDTMALQFTLKMYHLKAKKKELWKFKYFTMQKKIYSSKKYDPLKKNQNPSRKLLYGYVKYMLYFLAWIPYLRSTLLFQK